MKTIPATMHGTKLTTWTCDMCGEKTAGWGNNPRLITVYERVCDKCNALYVLPVRMGLSVQIPDGRLINS